MENRPVEISLTVLWNAVKKKIGVILLATVAVAVAVAVLYSLIYQPSYSSTTRYYVNNVSSDTSLYSSSQTTGATEMASNYVQFISGGAGSKLLQDIVRFNKLDLSENQNLDLTDQEDIKKSAQILAKRVDASCNGKDATFSVKVQGTDPEETFRIAEAIENVFPLYCHYMNSQLTSAEYEEAVSAVVLSGQNPDSKSVKVFQFATFDKEPDNAINKIIYPLFAGVAVFLIGVLAAVFTEFFNTTVYQERDLRERFPKIPVIGVIPHWSFHHSENAKNAHKGD